MRVFIFWNLNKDCYSIRALEGPHKGKVIGYSASVVLTDVTFTVRRAGRLQVLNGGHKQIHAGINGTLVSLERADTNAMRAITYNPRLHESFVYRDTLQAIHAARRVVCLTTPDERADCYAEAL